ncbi:hypothetical protein ASPVEDRAFT_142746 [Aspergillus versicolor CBS 583.65]|uniref:DUF7600 domain-containing protein n=1 Tax=Aspergillus versicolor CBS 583.65 TaxID=1036611 RepID=A0A1L9Q0Y1_ASPVE|nr:uncharacterized protein ASPVEDRAFT_142746 [Aspergillus versicolor CBS 583.65]OJJ07411.1 hypothetical protein ASPVEDRAFT_142746 [Aspergillus versicolor CBS 583.65]
MPIEFNSYCAFCGFILAGAGAPEPTPRRRRLWDEEVRGLTIMDDSGSPSLTGVGLVCPYKRLSAPHGRDLTYRDHQLSGDWGIRTTDLGSWAFGIHDACWQMLRFRLHGWQERDIITSAFHQLLCVPHIKSSWIGFHNDYIDQFRWSDPFAISFTDIEQEAMPLPSSSGGYLQAGSCRTFYPLSTELIHEVLSHLSCKEVANLPQSYWRSRFFLGQEADFLFPDFSETRDWRALFFGQRHLLQNDESTSLLTRRRICTMVEPFARVLEDAAVPLPGVFGITAHRVPGEKSRFQIITSDGAIQGPVVLEECNLLTADITSNNTHDLISHGCRVVDHVTCSLPNPHQYTQGRIAVSTFHIGLMTFIAGIGVFPFATSDDESCIIGFHNSGTTKWFDMPTASSIERIHVAFAEEGLTGVMFAFTDDTQSTWTGVSEGSRIAQGFFDVAGRPQGRYLMAGVDLYRIVSLGVYSRKDPTVQAETTPETASHLQNQLWIPRPPTYDGLQLTPLYPEMEPPPFEPLLNVDFGGPGGAHLSELTGLVCYMGYDPHPLLGMQAIYADGRTVLFGSTHACEVYFTIAGPDGERVTEVSIFHGFVEFPPPCVDAETVPTRLSGLQFKTNYGRTADFAPIQSRVTNRLHIMQKPASNHIITGLVVRRMPSKDPFIQVAVQSQPCLASSVPSSQFAPLPEPEICKESLQHDKRFSLFIRSRGAGNYQTHASLKGVRRIQASTGAEGRCRRSARISGLKLLYDNAPTAIVGQWMVEQECFDLAPDEGIAYLTVWILPVAGPPEWRPAQRGQVVALRFDTTKSRHITFTAPDSDTPRSRCLRQQFGNGDGYKLTDIYWVMNFWFERIRAIGRGTFERASVLEPEQGDVAEQTQKLYFDRMEHRGSNDPVVTANGWLDQGKLLGLEFIYMSGVTARVGEMHTTFGNIQTVHFPRDCTYVGITTGIKDSYIRVLKFEFEASNQSPLPTEYKTLGFGPPSSDEQKLPDCDWGQVGADEQGPRGPSRPWNTERIYTPPNGTRLVGVFFNCQVFASVGGLYEPV